MNLLLLFPPLVDPTAVPLGMASVRAAVESRHRHTCHSVDLNIRVVSRALAPEEVEASSHQLASRGVSKHTMDGGFALSSLAGVVASATAIMRDPGRFFDFASYRLASNAILFGLRASVAASGPYALNTDLNGIEGAAPCGHSATDYGDSVLRFMSERNRLFALMCEECERAIAECTPDVIGISQIFDAQTIFARSLIAFLADRYPKLQVIIGGTSAVEQFRRLRSADSSSFATLFGKDTIVVTGEADETLSPLLDALDAREPPPPDVNAAFLGPEGVVTRCPVFPESLESLPVPIYNAADLPLYLVPKPVLFYAPTRGCYWDKCAFCAYGLRTGDRATAVYREVPAVTAASHIQILKQLHGCGHFILAVDLLSPKYAEDLCGALDARGVSVHWQCESRAEAAWLRDDRLEQLHASGARHLSLGVETCSQEVLDLMSKGTKVATLGPLLERLHKVGIASDLMLFEGFPGETRLNVLESLKWLNVHSHLLHRPVRFGRFALLDGSAVQKNPQRYGITVEEPPGFMRPDLLPFASPSPCVNADVEDEIQREERRLCGHVVVGARPWVGSTGSVHTFLYFSQLGIDGVKRYNEFVYRLRRRLHGASARPVAESPL